MTYELYHHGILGQRWGVRRFQNKDGTLTSEGRRRSILRERKRILKYQKAGELTSKGEKKAYSPDGTLKPEFADKYYWRKNGELTTPGQDRSAYLKEVAFTNAKYASEHFRDRDSGQKLFDAEKALKEYAFIEKKSYDKVRNEIDEARQRRQQVAMNIAKHALSTNKVTQVDDHELDYARDHAKTLKTLVGTLDKYVRDIPDTSKQDKRVSDILDKYDMMMIDRIEQQSEGYRRYVYDE